MYEDYNKQLKQQYVHVMFLINMVNDKQCNNKYKSKTNENSILKFL